MKESTPTHHSRTASITRTVLDGAGHMASVFTLGFREARAEKNSCGMNISFDCEPALLALGLESVIMPIRYIMDHLLVVGTFV